MWLKRVVGSLEVDIYVKKYVKDPISFCMMANKEDVLIVLKEYYWSIYIL